MPKGSELFKETQDLVWKAYFRTGASKYILKLLISNQDPLSITRPEVAEVDPVVVTGTPMGCFGLYCSTIQLFWILYCRTIQLFWMLIVV